MAVRSIGRLPNPGAAMIPAITRIRNRLDDLEERLERGDAYARYANREHGAGMTTGVLPLRARIRLALAIVFAP